MPGGSSRRLRPCRTRCVPIPSCGSWVGRRSCSASPPTSSTCTTSTTSCACGGGASTASSTRTRCTWRSPDPRPRPVSPKPSPPTSPTPWTTPLEHKGEQPRSGAIYGGVAGGMTDEADTFIKAVMADMMDGYQQVPAGRGDRPTSLSGSSSPSTSGPGGPKVGLVSLTGAISWSDHVALGTRLLPGGGAVQDAEEWWEVIADATRRAHVERGGATRAGRGGVVHRTVGEHRARRRGRPSRR